MTDVQRQEDRDIRRAAHEWRTALALPQVSREEQERFRAWIEADQRHEAAFDRAETLFQAMGTLDAETLGPKVMRLSWRERLPDWLFSSTTGTLSPVRMAGVAASVIFAAILAIVMTGTSDDASRPAGTETLEFSTDVGELETVTLADGSSVTLGAKSTITVAFDDRSREIVLVSGAALFDVSSDPTRPFTVAAGSLRATAVGTRFDVRNNGGVARVAVAEGEVAISHPIVIAGNASGVEAQVSLTEGQQIAATGAEGLRGVEEISTAAVAAWQVKRLVYAGATLGELVADARRHARLEITVEDDTGTLGDARVTAFFDGSDIRGMMSTLPDILPVSVQETPSGTITIRPLP
ncbi:MAG: FecR domain-containing protein [Pseudomonadota bacterium]